jgi:hypothetical protein
LSRGGQEKSKEGGSEKLKYFHVFPLMKNKNQEIKVEIISDDTIKLALKDAVRFPLIPEKARGMLNEILAWLNSRYNFNAHVTLQYKRLGIIIEHDIIKDVDFCIEACVRREIENNLGPYETGQACAEDCHMSFKKNADFDFRIVLSEVKKVLDEHGFRHEIYDYWDFTTKKLVFVVKL